jgi:ribonucleoside-diphosphate reductase beta chain
MEPILAINHNRFVMKVQHSDLNELYKAHRLSFWSPEEISFDQDLEDWDNKLNDNEKFFIKHVLAFFAGSDGIVNENLVTNFHNEVQYPEARAFYTFQIAMETIHSETYRLLIETYVRNRDEQERLFEAIHNFPAIKKKAQWALKWTNPANASFVQRLIAFVAVEGIFFSGSFCSIFWLKKRGLMPGLTFSNELISRDEGLHCEFAINLYKNHIVNKLNCNEIEDILLSALDIEREFILEALPAKLIGINAQSMIQYLEFVTNRLLLQLGCNKKFKASNPFPFMDMISMEGKTNFFEKRVSEYKKLSAHNESLRFDEEF